jgi:peptidoglycan/LPS O-acetylase OafA/YrhL
MHQGCPGAPGTTLAGWALLAALERLTPQARGAWTLVALVILALSLAGPLGGGTTTAAKTALACMHLAAAAVLIPILARSVVRQ